MINPSLETHCVLLNDVIFKEYAIIAKNELAIKVTRFITITKFIELEFIKPEESL